MYFEGCLVFNVIQQSDLMREAFVGSLPITQDYSSPQMLSSEWTFRVAMWTWIIGYLPLPPSNPRLLSCRGECWRGHGRTQGGHPLSEDATLIKINLGPPLNKQLFWFSLIMKWLNILCVFCSPALEMSRRAAAAFRQPSDEARQLEHRPERGMLIRCKIFLLQR